MDKLLKILMFVLSGTMMLTMLGFGLYLPKGLSVFVAALGILAILSISIALGLFIKRLQKKEKKRS